MEVQSHFHGQVKIPAIIEAWYPGQSGGKAIAEVYLDKLILAEIANDILQKYKSTSPF